MSEADAQEGTPITAEGVTVEKSYELDEFPVPAVMFVIRSERSDPATIRLTDPLPPGVSTDDVGLHPNYGEESLSIEADHVALERELEPGEEFTAVYGLREVDEDDLESAPTTPENVEVTPPLGEADSSSQIVRDVIEGAGEDEEDEEVEPLDLRDPSEGDVAEGSAEDDSVTQPEAETDPAADIELDVGLESPETDDDLDAAITRADDAEPPAIDESEGVVSALAAELRAGRVDDDDLELLRDELEFGSGSDQARIQRLQTEVSDLQAYTDALEEFLDENGPAQQLLSDVRSQVERLESDLGRTSNQVERLESDLGQTTDRVQSHEETVTELESTLDAVESELNEFTATVKEHDETLAEVREHAEEAATTAEEVEETVEEVREDVESNAEELDELEETVDEAVDDVEERVGTVEERLEDVTADLESVREEAGDVEEVADRVDDLEETIEDMSEDLDEVADIQQRLQSVFGGGGDDEE